METSKRISTKIENKSFSCEFDANSRGRVIRLTEAHLNKSYTLLGEETLFGWLAESLEEVLQTSKPQKFFRKTFCNGGFTWIQKTTNKRGSFLEISKVLKSGKKGNIVVPAGVDLKGWESFRRLLMDFLNDEVDSRALHSEKKLTHKFSPGN
ncbi:transcription factor Pur-alpha 1-like [Cucumis sativus]|uniref:transcription factor Pur-alpha 1-like n=1 Tax=Cucumis sativus TaxID=3659 RepID=UPI0012F50F3D|nr:transcription factor Pur-alpha 1-like [Cucumis sativus]